MHTNTSLCIERLIEYVYKLCARSGSCAQIRLCAAYCVRILLVCLKRLMRTSVSLRVKRLILQRLGDALTWRWQSCLMISDSSDVAMTVVIDAISFVQRCNDHHDVCYIIRPTLRQPLWLCDCLDWSPWRICLKDAIFWSLFSDDLTLQLGRLFRLVFRVPPRSSFNIILR